MLWHKLWNHSFGMLQSVILQLGLDSGLSNLWIKHMIHWFWRISYSCWMVGPDAAILKDRSFEIGGP